MSDPNELHPWIIIVGTSPDSTLACWNLSATGKPAIALFSTHALSDAYAKAHIDSEWETMQPERNHLLQLLIESFRIGVEQAVLDPDRDSARSIFPIKDLLRAARDQLRQSSSS